MVSLSPDPLPLTPLPGTLLRPGPDLARLSKVSRLLPAIVTNALEREGSDMTGEGAPAASIRLPKQFEPALTRCRGV